MSFMEEIAMKFVRSEVSGFCIHTFPGHGYSLKGQKKEYPSCKFKGQNIHILGTDRGFAVEDMFWSRNGTKPLLDTKTYISP